MRRVLAILKYVPAVLCGLLVMAWVVSQIRPGVAAMNLGMPPASIPFTIGIQHGCIFLWHSKYVRIEN